MKDDLIRISRIFPRRLFIHLSGWLLFGSLLLLIEYYTVPGDFTYNLINSLILLGFFALIYYINIYVLIPRFLNRKSFFKYLLTLILTVAILSPLRNLVFFLRFYDQPELRHAILRDQSDAFFSLFIFGGIITLGKIMSDWFIQRREIKEMERQNLLSELKFLRSQINPHFLFNTLNSLYALTLKKSDVAPEIVLKLSSMMRYMLYDSNVSRVKLAKELEYITNYFDLEKLRFQETVDISLVIEGEVGDLEIAPMLFIPFVENSFKHGIENDPGKSFVHCSFQIHESTVVFKITNSRPEYSALETHSEIGGIGLKNVKKRLKLLYPDRHFLKMTPDPEKYHIYLHLTLDKL